MTSILVADNDETWLNDLCAVIEGHQYQVIRATTPERAMAILGSHSADIAVLDLKLKDDGEYDISGFKVARDSDRTVPKIIVSQYSSEKDFAQAYPRAFQVDVDAFPVVVDFVEKGAIESKLIPSVEHALRVKDTWSLSAQSKISKELKKDHERARREAKIHYWITLGVSIIFALIIFWGAYELHGAKGEGALPLILIVIGVLVAEATNYIFVKKLEFLYHRVERYHDELLQTDRFGQLLSMSYTIKNEKLREEFKLALFDTAASQWLCRMRRVGQPDSTPKGSESERGFPILPGT
jgi:CheY-like chemotaxis protein